MFAPDITACSLTFMWWQRPEVWRCTICKVDDRRQRVKPFTVEAESAEAVLAKAQAIAAEYEFPAVEHTYTRKSVPENITVEDLGLEIDL